MSEVENMPPTTTSAGKLASRDATAAKAPGKENVKKPTSDRKKLQTLQPSSKNQTLLVGADGKLRVSGKKEQVKVFEDPPAATSTPERRATSTSTPTRAVQSSEAAVQASPPSKEGCSQVEAEDTAAARAQAFMHGEEEPDIEYWKQLAERRREALESSLLENEELHTSLTAVEEEKELVARERDNLREMAEQAEELAKIVKSLVPEEDSEEEGAEEGDDKAESDEAEEEEDA